MENFLRAASPIIVLIFVVACLTGCDDKKVLKLMESRSKTVKSFQADITLDQFNSQLQEHDITKGKLIYVPQGKSDAHIRIDLNKPVQESFVFFDRQYTLYRPNLNRVIIGNVSSRKGFGKFEDALAFMNVNSERLQSSFNIKYLGEEKINGADSVYHMEFTPKTVQDYKTVEFWIDKSGMPIQIKILVENGDLITISFTNIKKNIKLSPDIFKINFPKNAKIIRS